MFKQIYRCIRVDSAVKQITELSRFQREEGRTGQLFRCKQVVHSRFTEEIEARQRGQREMKVLLIS